MQRAQLTWNGWPGQSKGRSQNGLLGWRSGRLPSGDRMNSSRKRGACEGMKKAYRSQADEWSGRENCRAHSQSDLLKDRLGRRARFQLLLCHLVAGPPESSCPPSQAVSVLQSNWNLTSDDRHKCEKYVKRLTLAQ